MGVACVVILFVNVKLNHFSGAPFMGKKIIFCFDGTCNDPEDADQDASLRGGVKDANITNILKLHLLFGGGLTGEQAFAPEQKSFYFQGVGTYGGIFKRFLNMTIAPKKADVKHIIHMARDTLQQVWQTGDELYLFGFSRGAAIARRFASIIGKEYGFTDLTKPNSIRFVGVFDTVASIGKPNIDFIEYPDDEVVFENNQVNPAVQEALHLLAMDDRRVLFFPTLMHDDPRITEVWFPGAHSDVGGGYWQDGLSDITLEFLLDELKRRSLGLKVRKPEEIDYTEANMVKAGLQQNDVAIKPDPLDKCHQQKLIEHRTVRKDGPGLPVVHEAAVTRIRSYVGYRPSALKGVPHQIMNGQGVIVAQASGLDEHMANRDKEAKPVAVGESHTLTVDSSLLFNRSRAIVQPGETYRFDIDMSQKWNDGGIECGPDGWTLGMVTLGLKEAFIFAAQPFRRNPDADWFEVVGVVGDDDGEAVRPLKVSGGWQPQQKGELLLYANDLKDYYGNNAGAISLTMTRTA